MTTGIGMMKREHGRCMMKSKTLNTKNKKFIFYFVFFKNNITFGFRIWVELKSEIFKYPTMGLEFDFLFFNFVLDVEDKRNVDEEE